MVRIHKEYEIKLNVTPVDQYTATFTDDKYLLEHLKEKFENRCMDMTYVVAIKGILSRSMMTIDKSDLAGGAYIHVRFHAEAIVFSPGSILVGCEVINVERNEMIVCKYDNAIVRIKGNKNFSPSEGDLVIVRVELVGYPV